VNPWIWGVDAHKRGDKEKGRGSNAKETAFSFRKQQLGQGGGGGGGGVGGCYLVRGIPSKGGEGESRGLFRGGKEANRKIEMS